MAFTYIGKNINLVGDCVLRNNSLPSVAEKYQMFLKGGRSEPHPAADHSLAGMLVALTTAVPSKVAEYAPLPTQTRCSSGI